MITSDKLTKALGTFNTVSTTYSLCFDSGCICHSFNIKNTGNLSLVEAQYVLSEEVTSR